MRFDDRIATVLRQEEADAAALQAKWRQLVDLLAQHPHTEIGPDRERALAFLRDRRDDIPPVVRDRVAASLRGCMPPDLKAVFEPQGSPAAQKAEAQIRDIAARIDALRQARESGPGDGPRAMGFRWEAGAEGVILWVEGAPRGPLVGQSIACAAPGQPGVDGQAAGAFRHRAPFRDARFAVPGDGEASGEWRLSGVPFFDPAQGNFLGYRGTARRPRVDETAAPAQPASGGLFGTDLDPESLRQLIHELRTPLNAIVGFAEMIDGQYLGPAGERHRTRAAAIREEAMRLLSAVDDLDTAARIETSRFPTEKSQVDAAALLARLQVDYERVARQRGCGLRIDFAPDLPFAAMEAAAAERMVSRLLAATVGLAGEGETLFASLATEAGKGGRRLRLSIARPRAIQGRPASDLLDPGYSPEGDWPEAPALGLGFALRLVRNLAETVGGSLEIEAERFSLYLPAAGIRSGREEKA